MKKIAIAGLGAAASHIHLPAYAKLSDLEVVGGFDPAVTSSGNSFPLFSSLDEMLDRTRPDILAVITPTAAHYELTRQGLLAGCHVFCEKPFMATMDEARRIVSLSKEMNRWVVVNNQYRFMNIHQAARNNIGKPGFGDLLFVAAQQTFFVSEDTEKGWRGQGNRRTCMEFGTHVFDLCRFFFGEDPIAIDARMPKAGDPGGPDFLNLIRLEFAGDRVAHITLDRLSRGPHRYLDIRLDGSEGIIETSLGGNVEFNAGIRGGSRKPYMNLDISMGGRARIYHGDSYRKIAADPLDLFPSATSRLLGEFISAIDHDRVPPCHAEDNARTLALMLAAYESAEKGEAITMQY